MKSLTIVTHSGRFHADDCFAVAALLILVENKPVAARVVRTRDEAVITEGDIVVDVGGVHDPKKARFDHHQAGGAGKRENGVPYASFGLVWKEYGLELSGSEIVARAIDVKLVQPIDAYDNGETLYSPERESVQPYLIDNIVGAFVPTWKEENDSQAVDRAFQRAVAIAKELLSREIKKIQDKFEAEKYVREAYEKAEDKRLLILEGNYPWRDVADTLREVLFVVHPSDAHWHILAVRKNLYEFASRKNLPAAWAGKREAELAAVSGVKDAIFCHNKLFIAVARSREGAIELAQKALKA